LLNNAIFVGLTSKIGLC